jgi:hypothetical protein
VSLFQRVDDESSVRRFRRWCFWIASTMNTQGIAVAATRKSARTRKRLVNHPSRPGQCLALRQEGRHFHDSLRQSQHGQRSQQHPTINKVSSERPSSSREPRAHTLLLNRVDVGMTRTGMWRAL